MVGPDPGCTRHLLDLGERNAVMFEISLLTRNNTLRRHLTLIGMAEDIRCRKCGLEEESSFHIFCKCDALAGIRQKVLSKAYQDAASIREVELEAMLHLCQSAAFYKLLHRRPMSWFLVAGLTPQGK